MLATPNTLNLLDIVALKTPLSEHNLLAGQVGTIVEILAPEVYEVEFSDDDGQTYAMQALPAHQLLKLHYKPLKTMSNTINQFGKGDNVAGDKIQGDKNQNDFKNATIGIVAQNQAQATVSNLNQTSGASVAELMQIINTMRQTAAQFPPEFRDDIIIDIDDVEAEIQKPEKERNLPKLKKRLLALLTAASVAAAPIAGITDFTNNVIDIGNKVGIELKLPSVK
ncbi:MULTISPECIES: DUF4926 domain-containing protein [unclassified Nostoc]|uniref:DUF4926 domain-containing protein n=1 Tax=unclassified Nostoc TaxID=2593658 RepID=UPI002AD315F8|nr:DUF4926 domain-containing protein [Nostoc sp. DedQUE03]MDZ7975046.1 DUF4926 domain-containing protein [Nostoc sp. DedQUE03]MDZ8043655.1 DUF4926 domain-containing protein [Nostoc sp. DedQUE02]